MGFCSQFKALLKKNFIVWYRNLCGSLCELLFPVILMLIIVLVRNLVSDEEIDARNYIGSGKLGYYFDKDTKLKTEGDLYMPDNDNPWLGLSPAAPFASCLEFEFYQIAFVGDSTLMEGLKKQLFDAGNCCLITS